MAKKAIYAVILAACIAGLNGILIKKMPDLSTGAIAWFRAGIPVLFLLPGLIRANDFKVSGNYKMLLLASGINALRMYFYLIAFIYTSIGNAVVLFYIYPLFVTIIESLIYKTPIKKTQIYLMLLAFIGIVFTYINKPFSFESKDFIGMLAALLAAVGYAFFVSLFKRQTGHCNRNQLLFYQNIAGAVLFLPFLFGIESPPAEELGIAVFYALLIGILVFSLFFFGLKHLNATTAASLMYLEILSAIIYSYFLLGEKLTWNTYVGGSLILISSFFISRINKTATSES
ncbi:MULTISPECIES: DMT family transporter [unclassified Leeuwenhoekiella]|uniref:DMT family transporter n=1 Tax=unclassified Leeuwenhoekiella TaxID=2615029 RepID=UPI000C3CD7E2|nr:MULTISPECIES: DMT family transporter [unclassified Leeuwenhoekiella]MAW95319.1 permease [Leeuwenhoekiella sp.]MBA81757.1 permease [Leeuwenhoekiella sp.]|tara:strand:+ start:5505 stop:6365 length:861 start_codon:yes stop_codon:yes gene_type:complete